MEGAERFRREPVSPELDEFLIKRWLRVADEREDELTVEEMTQHQGEVLQALQPLFLAKATLHTVPGKVKDIFMPAKYSIQEYF